MIYMPNYRDNSLSNYQKQICSLDKRKIVVFIVNNRIIILFVIFFQLNVPSSPPSPCLPWQQ